MKQQMWLFGDFGWGGVGSDRTLGEEHWAPGSTLNKTACEEGQTAHPEQGVRGCSWKCSRKAG